MQTLLVSLEVAARVAIYQIVIGNILREHQKG